MVSISAKSGSISKRISAILAALLLLIVSAQSVQAGPIMDEDLLNTSIIGGSMLVATDGNVFAGFLGSDAGYFNTLFLDSPSDWGTQEIFNKYTPVGSIVDLGTFTAGTELIFRIDVLNTSLSYFTGDGSRNPDGIAHAEAITTLSENLYVTTVGFEDLYGGGDEDYNDFVFWLTNVIDPQTNGIPEPPILLLMMIALLGLWVQRRRRSKTS